MNYDRKWLTDHLYEILSLEVECFSAKTLMEQLEATRIPLMSIPDEFIPPKKPDKPTKPKDPSLPIKPDTSLFRVISGAVTETRDLLEEPALIVGIVLL